MVPESKEPQLETQKTVKTSYQGFAEVGELRSVQTGEEQICSRHLYMQSQLIKFNQQTTKVHLQKKLLFSQIANDINFSKGMRQKLAEFKAVLYEIKTTLEIIKENYTLQRVNSTSEKSIGYLGQHLEPPPQSGHKTLMTPPLIYEEIKKIEISQQIECERVANKLKVIVSKVEERRSDIQNRHPFDNYITRLIDDLEDDKMSKNFTERDIERNYEMINLKNKFKVLNYPEMLRYTMHPTEHPDFQIPKTLFYVNLYNECLLFLLGEPLTLFSNNILFCPILLESMSEFTWQQEKSHVAISQWYIEQLNQENSHWMDFSLYLYVRETRDLQAESQRSSRVVYWSKASVEKIGNKMRENSLINNLKKIRGFVYMNMVFKWLKVALLTRNIEDCTSIDIQIDSNTTVQIATTSLPLISEAAQEKPGFIKHFLSYFSEKRMKARNEKKREDLTLNFVSEMKVMIKSMHIEHAEEYQGNFKNIYVSGKRVRR